MEDLTFGEQVKIILGRKGMTIKRLAEMIEAETGKKMSRQNLTQRLGRDNFQEQDMRMIARILDCPFHLSIMTEAQVPPRSTAALEQETIVRTEAVERAVEKLQENMAQEAEKQKTVEQKSVEQEPADRTEPEPEEQGASEERDMTIGELYDIHQELSQLEETVKAGEPVENAKKELEKPKKERFYTGGIFHRRKNKEENDSVTGKKQTDPSERRQNEEQTESVTQEYKEKDFEPVIRQDDVEEDREIGEINPYTGREYQSNSVRMHPTRIGYVQVYDRTIHKWTDMTEWAFLGLQERKKALLGRAYEPPIYLD